MKRIIIILAIAGVLVLLFVVNPEHAVLVPKCPFYLVTGLECPACGVQRAIHHALHLEFGTAFLYNPFLLISVPYLIALVITTWFDPNDKLNRLRRFCNHRITVYTYLSLLIIWWVVRNHV